MQCLLSNKEDTANAISMIGELSDENDSLKIQLNNLQTQFSNYEEYAESCMAKEKRVVIATNIIIPLTTIPMIISGGILMAANNEYGKPMLYTGAGLLIGCEVVFNGGHFVFKVW